MLILGITGGTDLVHEDGDFLFQEGHDSAAALIEDGQIIAAIEEERLNRIKHTSKGPVSAIKFCLDRRGARLSDVDRFVVAGDENVFKSILRHKDYRRVDAERLKEPRAFIHDLLLRGLGQDIDDLKISFVRHHLSHAFSAYALSGFDSSLILSIDGAGDDVSGTVMNANSSSLDLLKSYTIPNSLGLFYLNVTNYLGFSLFDEYKIMGLAPYGDPSTLRHIFSSFYELLPDGDYRIKMKLPNDLLSVAPPRKKYEPLTQVHKDISAALQESLERIVFHLLRHYRELTSQRRLSFAGGVAHNCTLNGKLLKSGLFDALFVQPAAHDAGLVLGAALYTQMQESGWPSCGRNLRHVYLGGDTGSNEDVEQELNKWRGVIDYERKRDLCKRAARLIAEGNVIGWVQGRSEFGPRALGNRSIVADARPASNRDRINLMVKKREGFRPFAPSVQVERVKEYFDVEGAKADFGYMTFAVKVKKEKREQLGAVTHVDGTARIQTVSKESNKRYWELIEEFGKQTGVWVVLNTSFNNNVEPIVETVRDAVVSYLTTGLDYLVIGSYVVKRRKNADKEYERMMIDIPAYVVMRKSNKYAGEREKRRTTEIGNTYEARRRMEVSDEVYRILEEANGERYIGELMNEVGVEEAKKKQVMEEIRRLWSLRVVTLLPRLETRSSNRN